MNVVVDISFEKDLSKLKDRKVVLKALGVVRQMRDASALSEIKSIKKLKGTQGYYRKRMGDYRIGFSYLNDEIVLYRFLHRKEMYRYFP